MHDRDGARDAAAGGRSGEGHERLRGGILRQVPVMLAPFALLALPGCDADLFITAGGWEFCVFGVLVAGGAVVAWACGEREPNEGSDR